MSVLDEFLNRIKLFEEEKKQQIWGELNQLSESNSRIPKWEFISNCYYCFLQKQNLLFIFKPQFDNFNFDTLEVIGHGIDDEYSAYSLEDIKEIIEDYLCDVNLEESNGKV